MVQKVQCHVSEVYSPPRVTGVVYQLKMIPGMALEVTTVDPEDSRPWDFNDRDKKQKALEMVKEKRALLVIGSPMCKAFSRLQRWNFRRMNPQKVERMIKEGLEHLRFLQDTDEKQDVLPARTIQREQLE